jgi:CPA2 family monovalent cation:H+ antiporter-2
MAAIMSVPPIIGAFFIGMILAESKVTMRVQSKLESFKDAFVAIFFTTFGMMIDPAMFKNILWMLVLAVPIILLYQVLVISSIAYFLGFSSKASTTIGTSMCGRGVESILYASVGSRAQGATMGATLNPFAGAYCFIMSSLTPVLVKHSSGVASGLSKLVPKPLRFSGAVVSRTLGKAVMPSNIRLFKSTKVTGVLLASFVAVCIAILLTQSYIRMFLTLGGLVLAGAIFFVIRREIMEIARHVSYTNIGVGTDNKDNIVDLVSGLVFGAVLSVLLIVFSWAFAWQYSIVISAAYLVFVVCLMFWGYGALYSGEYVPRKVYNFPKPVVEDAEPILDIPKPVYGVVRSVPKDMRL